MTLTRWRRVATGIAAGVLVLCAALLGASLRSDSTGVSVASESRPTDVIAIPEDTEDLGEVVADDAGEDDDSVQVIEVEDLPDTADEDAADAADEGAADTTDEDTTDEDTTDSEDATDTTDEDAANSEDTADTTDEDAADTTDEGVDDSESAADEVAGDTATNDSTSEDAAAADTTESASTPEAPPAPAPAAPAPAAPPAPSNGLGTGGGVNDAECGLDRLVIYAGAPVGGVAGRLRSALSQNGFGAGCAGPVTVLASNCPQQFSGVLRAGAGYDPSKPYVAASATVDRDTMIAIVGATGYTGSTIDILNFGFVNADRPGEQWVAIFVPPSFAGWEGLAGQAGLAPSSQSLCGPSGELGR